MHYQIHQPTGPLRRYVKALWSLELQLGSGETATERVAPNGCACLLLHLGNPPRVLNTDGQGSAQLRAQVSGQKTTFTDLEVSGHVHMVAVILRPEATSAVLGLPAHELGADAVDLGDLFDAPGRRLAEQLAHCPDPAARFAHLQSFLWTHLARVDAAPDRCMGEVVRRVTASGGTVRVQELARGLDLSTRQLERKVAAAVGLSPKAFCRVVRYQKSLALKQHHPSLSLTELAYEAGYADQAHFNREFRTITGLTPAAAFDACPAFSDYYTFE